MRGAEAALRPSIRRLRRRSTTSHDSIDGTLPSIGARTSSIMMIERIDVGDDHRWAKRTDRPHDRRCKQHDLNPGAHDLLHVAIARADDRQRQRHPRLIDIDQCQPGQRQQAGEARPHVKDNRNRNEDDDGVEEHDEIPPYHAEDVNRVGEPDLPDDAFAFLERYKALAGRLGNKAPDDVAEGEVWQIGFESRF